MSTGLIVLIGVCSILLIFLSNFKFKIDDDPLSVKKDKGNGSLSDGVKTPPQSTGVSREDEIKYIHSPPVELDIATRNLSACEQIHGFINIELNKLHGGLLDKTRGGLTTCTSKLNEKLDTYRNVYQKIYGREMTQEEFEIFKHKIEMN